MSENPRVALNLSRLVAALSFSFAVAIFIGLLHDLIRGTNPNLLAYVDLQAGGQLMVTGFRDGGEQAQGLIIGDVVVASGEVTNLPDRRIDLRYLVASTRSLTVERNGSRLMIDLEENLYALPAAAVARALILLTFGVLIILFGRAAPATYIAAAIVFCFGHFGQGAPIGFSQTFHHLAIIANALCIGMMLPLCTNLAQAIGGVVQVKHYLLPWVMLVNAPLFYAVYENLIPKATVISMTTLAISALWPLFAIIKSYRKATGIQRHQLNWILMMTTVAVTGVLLFTTLSTFLGDYTWLFLAVGWITMFVPLGIVLAVLKADFANVDRTAAVTVTYGVIIVTLALLFEFVFEPIAGLLSVGLGLPESAGQTVLIVLVALAAPKMKDFLMPRVMNLVAPVQDVGVSDMAEDMGER